MEMIWMICQTLFSVKNHKFLFDDLTFRMLMLNAQHTTIEIFFLFILENGLLHFMQIVKSRLSLQKQAFFPLRVDLFSDGSKFFSVRADPFFTTVNSCYLEFQGTLWNTSRYPYLEISGLQKWGKQ